MAAKPDLTARRVRLGIELRRLRERARLTSTAAAELLGTRPGQISNIETARFGVGGDRVRAMAVAYGCRDELFVSALVDVAQDRTRGWWEEYRGVLPAGLLDLAELEHHAVALRTAYTAHIPGLLQTADHARVVFQQVVPELSPPQIEHRVSHRVKRQDVIYRTDPLRYSTIVHEAALRMKFGGAATARRQLEHLIAMGEREHITLSVIPFDAGAYPGSGQSVAYAVGPVPQLDTVHLDQSHGSVLLDARAQLQKYRTLLGRMEAVALNPAKSRDFIHSIAQQL
ncbi:DUF5753 domain-containing protein [Streptomyces sp. NPDC096310]|uniref:DUF5753 domain-containing protein n=1 Tax=Streptomyces sp. NPDC096310 TaxID=3366082 RepID=UPI003806D5DE